MSALGGVGSAIEADLTAIKAVLTWSNEATAFSDEDRAPLAPGPFSFEGRSLRPDGWTQARVWSLIAAVCCVASLPHQGDIIGADAVGLAPDRNKAQSCKRFPQSEDVVSDTLQNRTNRPVRRTLAERILEQHGSRTKLPQHGFEVL